MITLNIYFKCNLLNKGQTCLGGRMCWTPFKSVQHHKKKEILRVHCSALIDRKIVEISAIFILLAVFFHYIGNLSLGADISAIFLAIFVEISPLRFFSTKYHVDPSQYTISRRYIPTFSSLPVSCLHAQFYHQFFDFLSIYRQFCQFLDDFSPDP